MSVCFGPTRVNGVAYSNALVASPSSYQASRFEIDAGRAYKRFRGELGIPDSQKSATAYKVDISLDNGPSVLSTEVRFGEVKTVDLDVTNVLRVKVAITPLSGEGQLAIGNARFAR